MLHTKALSQMTLPIRYSIAATLSLCDLPSCRINFTFSVLTIMALLKNVLVIYDTTQ